MASATVNNETVRHGLCQRNKESALSINAFFDSFMLEVFSIAFASQESAYSIVE
jgi:hypothetical protein